MSWLRGLFYLEFYLGKLGRYVFKKRASFESRNDWQPGSISYKEEAVVADLCVEFSSEGEFEQVKIFLEKVLENPKRKIEIIYCSESVEDKVVEFHSKYRSQVRYLILPFFSRKNISSLKDWVTAKRLILVRYDFFPQLLMLREHVEFMALFSASVKSIRNKNFLLKKFYKKVFQLFDLIVTVNSKELEWFKSDFMISSQKLLQADLRVNQILKRINKAENTLKSKYDWWETIESYLKGTKKTKMMIGNFWLDEYDNYKIDEIVAAVKSGELSLSIAPHNLSDEINQEIQKRFESYDIPVLIIKENFSTTDIPPNAILLFDIKGVLCELYNYYDVALVGGGFLRTTHSLLEPYVAGAKVITGPQVQKSSEYDFIISQDEQAVRIHHSGSSLKIAEWRDWIQEKNLHDSINDATLSTLEERVVRDA